MKKQTLFKDITNEEWNKSISYVNKLIELLKDNVVFYEDEDSFDERFTSRTVIDTAFIKNDDNQIIIVEDYYEKRGQPYSVTEYTQFYKDSSSFNEIKEYFENLESKPKIKKNYPFRK